MRLNESLYAEAYLKNIGLQTVPVQHTKTELLRLTMLFQHVTTPFESDYYLKKQFEFLSPLIDPLDLSLMILADLL